MTAEISIIVGDERCRTEIPPVSAIIHGRAESLVVLRDFPVGYMVDRREESVVSCDTRARTLEDAV